MTEMSRFSTRKAAAVLLTTAVLTIGPAAGAAWAAQAPNGSTCTQTENNHGSSSSSTSPAPGSSSTSGGAGLDPQVLQQAQYLVDQTRAMLATLISSDDPRAGALVEQLRGMGITPAVATGWRQRAHDVADSLLTEKAPAAQQAAMILARAGFSPTPADLRGPNAQAAVKRDQAPAAQGVVSAANAAPAVARSGPTDSPASTTSGSAMGAVLAEVATIATAAADSTPAGGSGSVQVCDQSTSDAGTTLEKADTGDADPSGPTPAPSTASGPGTDSGTGEPSSTGSADSGGDASTGGADGSDWDTDLQALADDLAGQVDDSDAQALAEKLRAGGFHGSTPDTHSPGSDATTGANGDGGSSQDSAGDDDGAGAARAPETTPETGSGSAAGGSAGAAAPQGRGAAGKHDLDGEVCRLAEQLQAVPGDPVAQQLAEALSSAGFAGEQAGSTPDSGSESTSGSSGAAGEVNRSDGSGSDGSGPGGGSRSSDTAGGSSDPSDDSHRGSSGAGGSTSGDDSPATGSSPTPSPSDQDDPAPSDSGEAQGAAPTTGADSADAVWDKLAQCESSGNWTAESSDGLYSGGLQFDAATWKAYGGDEYAPSAAEASRDEQIAVAEKLREDRGGYSAWPACSKRLGLQ